MIKTMSKQRKTLVDKQKLQPEWWNESTKQPPTRHLELQPRRYQDPNGAFGPKSGGA